MLEFEIDGVDIFNPIKNLLPNFIEAHVKVYGEKYREQITQNLTSATFIFPIVDEDFFKLQLNYGYRCELENCITPQQTQKIEEKYQQIWNLITTNANNRLKIVTKHHQIKINFIKKVLITIMESNKIDTSNIQNFDNLIEQYTFMLKTGFNKFKQRCNFLSNQKKQSYCQFFEALGFKKCATLEDLLNNKKIEKILFNQKIIDRLNTIEKNESKELLNSNMFVLNAINQLKTLNLQQQGQCVENLINYMQTDASTLDSPTASAYVERKYNTANQVQTICYFSNNPVNDLQTLIHEMGHIVDFTHTQTGTNTFLDKTGFNSHSVIVLPPKTTSLLYNYINFPTSDTNPYVMFNEIINEYLAIKVAKEFESSWNNLTLGYRVENVINMYSLAFDVFGDFIEHHLDKIIQFKMENNHQNLIAYFGKKNLANLMTIANEYVKQKTQLASTYKSLELCKQEFGEIFLTYKKMVDQIDYLIISKNKKTALSAIKSTTATHKNDELTK